jgi:hypothetical protein
MAPSIICQPVAGSSLPRAGAHNNQPFNSLTRARTDDMCAVAKGCAALGADEATEKFIDSCFSGALGEQRVLSPNDDHREFVHGRKQYVREHVCELGTEAAFSGSGVDRHFEHAESVLLLETSRAS